ncbi:hypothetical protein, partial [Lactobacillus sp. HMSC08B12]|uniref:hypothetical protein n=1 Tax=Lactobacillus sp. HMSC08B12 TaxID=1581136 RepID=UPI001AF016D2
IHASHAGCDMALVLQILSVLTFQSTHPMRDTTKLTTTLTMSQIISIHASHAGCDFSSVLVVSP